MTTKTKETVNILDRFSGAVRFSAEIECAPDALPSVKLGLAVKIAIAKRANLQGADLRGASLQGANLQGADLWGADLGGADLGGANLRGANLQDADLRGANLQDADLGGADLWGADLRGANLQDADLGGANLRGADLRGANLQGANLRGANLGGANLRGANLGGAHLGGANLGGADLGGADLWGEKITRLIGRATRLIESYEFLAFELEAGGYKIMAGCRWFSDAEFRAHVAKDYPGSDKASETLAILDFIKARAAALGVSAEVSAPAAIAKALTQANTEGEG